MRDTPQPVAKAATRQLTCAQCGGGFDCSLDGNCWCAEETVRLPMPATGADCLCPRCLREAAHLHQNAKSKS